MPLFRQRRPIDQVTEEIYEFVPNHIGPFCHPTTGEARWREKNRGGRREEAGWEGRGTHSSASPIALAVLWYADSCWGHVVGLCRLPVVHATTISGYETSDQLQQGMGMARRSSSGGRILRQLEIPRTCEASSASLAIKSLETTLSSGRGCGLFPFYRQSPAVRGYSRGPSVSSTHECRRCRPAGWVSTACSRVSSPGIPAR